MLLLQKSNLFAQTSDFCLLLRGKLSGQLNVTLHLQSLELFMDVS